MNLPDLAPWAAGTPQDATLFNAFSAALRFLLNPPEAEVCQTAPQPIVSAVVINTSTPAVLDTVLKDNDGMWNAAAPTVLTVNTPGWYEATYAATWAASADQTKRAISLGTNGTTVGLSEYANDPGPVTPQLWATFDLYLNAGDTVSLGLSQETGVSLSTASSATDPAARTFLRLRWASL